MQLTLSKQRSILFGMDRQHKHAVPHNMKHEAAACALAALGHPVRLQLYRCLMRAGCAGLSVVQLQTKADIPRSTLVHHLSKLVTAGLVVQEKTGASVIGRVDFDLMQTLLVYIQEECCLDVPDSGCC